MTFLLLKCGIIHCSIVFIAIGITADNLMIAKLSGKSVSVISQKNWIMILLLLFMMQNQMLIWGRWITCWIPLLTADQKNSLALALLISIATKIVKDHFVNRKDETNITYTGNNILLLAFSPAIYLLVFAMSISLLDQTEETINMVLLVLILFFLGIGVWLGKTHRHKLIYSVHTVCICLMMVGMAMLLWKLVK